MFCLVKFFQAGYGVNRLSGKPACKSSLLHISLREDLDKGTPTVISRPESEFTAIYRQLADRVAAQLYWQGEVIPGEISFRAV